MRGRHPRSADASARQGVRRPGRRATAWPGARSRPARGDGERLRLGPAHVEPVRHHGRCPEPAVRDDATADAHCRIASWSRKSPSGACTTRVAARSTHRGSWRSSRPANSWCPGHPRRHRAPRPRSAHPPAPADRRADHWRTATPASPRTPLVPLDQIPRGGQPTAQVHRTTDHRGVVAGHRPGLRRIPQIDDRACDVARNTAAISAAISRGRPVPGRTRNQDPRHLPRSSRALGDTPPASVDVVQVERETVPVTTASAANTGAVVNDAAGEVGSARAPNHWSVATPMPSSVSITSIAPVTSSPHARRSQHATAAGRPQGTASRRSTRRARDRRHSAVSAACRKKLNAAETLAAAASAPDRA